MSALSHIDPARSRSVAAVGKVIGPESPATIGAELSTKFSPRTLSRGIRPFSHSGALAAIARLMVALRGLRAEGYEWYELVRVLTYIQQQLLYTVGKLYTVLDVYSTAARMTVF